MSDESTAETESAIQREDIRVTKSEDGPVLEVGAVEILLRTFVEVEDLDERRGYRDVPMQHEVDCDGDNGCWWNLTPEKGKGEGQINRSPFVSIQPEVSYLDA